MLSLTLMQFLSLGLHLQPVNVDLILHTVELVIPSLSHILFLNHALESILSELLVGSRVLVHSQSPTQTLLEVLVVVGHKIEAIAFLGGRVELEH